MAGSSRSGSSDLGSSRSGPPQSAVSRPETHPQKGLFSWFPNVFVRLVNIAVAIAALVWIFGTFNANRISAALFIRPVATHLLAGEGFPTDLLRRVEAGATDDSVQYGCDYIAWQDLAVIRISLVDAAFEADDAESAGNYLSGAQDAAERVLQCSPGSTLAWTLLAWIELIRHDDTPRLHSLLDMSYRTGPFESWSLVRRLEILLRLNTVLTEAEKAQLLSQVQWLLQFNLEAVVGEMYVNGGEAQRTMLREIFAKADQKGQRRIAQYIRGKGETPIDLPLVEPEGGRPWR